MRTICSVFVDVCLNDMLDGSHINRDVLKSQIYLCSRVQPCIKEEEKCKVYHHRYHRNLLCDGDGINAPVNNNVIRLVY